MSTSTIWIYTFMVNLRYTEKHNFNVIFTYVWEKKNIVYATIHQVITLW